MAVLSLNCDEAVKCGSAVGHLGKAKALTFEYTATHATSFSS